MVFYPRSEAVLSARVDSVVTKIYKEFGQSFSAKMPLVKLDASIYKWNLKKAESILLSAQKTLAVIEQLNKQSSASVLELEEARKKIAEAQFDVKLARFEVDKCTIYAPFAGRVHTVLVNKNEHVESGTPAIYIVMDKILFAKILLPSNKFKTTKLNKKVSIRVNEIGKTVSGVISHISSAMDPASATFEIYAEVKNNNSELRSGMTGQMVVQP